jgi:hypothetical protein
MKTVLKAATRASQDSAKIAKIREILERTKKEIESPRAILSSCGGGRIRPPRDPRAKRRGSVPESHNENDGCF